jgi:hypothetical protein
MSRYVDDQNQAKIIISFAKDLGWYEEFVRLLNKSLLPMISKSNKSEADFQGILHGIAEFGYAFFKNNATHSVQSEYSQDNERRIDTIFFPIESKSTTIIIHEYKKNEFRSQNERKKLMEDALWQIYSNGYMNIPVSLKKDTKKIYWKFIITRAIVFFKDPSSAEGIWQADVKEYKHSFKVAKKLVEIFPENLRNKNSKIEFLKVYNVANIYEFLDKYHYKDANLKRMLISEDESYKMRKN